MLGGAIAGLVLLASPTQTACLLGLRHNVAWHQIRHNVGSSRNRIKSTPPKALPMSIVHDVNKQQWEKNKPFEKPHRFKTGHWWKTLLATPQSNVLRGIAQPVFTMSFFTLLVSIAYYMWPTLPSLSFKLGALSPHSIVGPALSLLLVFRTNAAYTRF